MGARGAVRVGVTPAPRGGRVASAIGARRAVAATAVTIHAAVQVTAGAPEGLHEEHGCPVELEVEDVPFLQALGKGE